MDLVGVIREEHHGIQRIGQGDDAEPEPTLALVRFARVEEGAGRIDRDVLGGLDDSMEGGYENRVIGSAMLMICRPGSEAQPPART